VTTLPQKRYTLEVLQKIGMTDCKSVATPMEPCLKLLKEMLSKTDLEHTSLHKIPYLATIGSLMYLEMTT